jgi:hypothetical protein
LAFLEQNLGLNFLKDAVGFGWSIFKLVDGVADNFSDYSGILSYPGGNWSSSYNGYFINPYGLGSSLFVGGTGSASASTGTATPDRAFDGNLSNYWYTDNGGINAWLKYDCVTPKVVNYINIYAWQGVYAPYSFQFQGSNDNVNWTTLYTSAVLSWSATSTEAKTFSISNSTAYRWYRLYMTPQTANYFGVNDFAGYFYQPSNMTLTSVVTTAQAVPDDVRVIALWQPSASYILNTDCTFEVSRNGGTSWTQAPLVYEGEYDSGGIKVISAYVSVASQPSGTAMQWRFKTLNNKEQKLHAVYLQWG